MCENTMHATLIELVFNSAATSVRYVSASARFAVCKFVPVLLLHLHNPSDLLMICQICVSLRLNWVSCSHRSEERL